MAKATRSKKNASDARSPERRQVPVAAKTGRKRDPSLDGSILKAASETLADVGFDSMTMDQVAARAGSAKTTLYRRWPSKAELVRDTLLWMSQKSVDVENVPDTGTLRGDLLAVQRDYSEDHSQHKVRVLSKLGSFETAHSEIAQQVLSEIFEPMTAMNMKLMERALKRGEVSPRANLELACETIVAMITFRTKVAHKSFAKSDYAALLDAVILPALKAPAPTKK